MDSAVHAHAQGELEITQCHTQQHRVEVGHTTASSQEVSRARLTRPLATVAVDCDKKNQSSALFRVSPSTFCLSKLLFKEGTRKTELL